MKGNANSSSTYERTVFPEGIYPMTLDKAFVMWGKPSQYAPEGAPKIGMVWKYTDDEGNEYELMDFLTFPKNFAYNDKSNFWKRVGEIAGAAINKENVGDVDLNLGEFIQSYDELIEHVRSVNDQGRPEKADVKSLLVGEQELLGKKCQLVVKVWQNGEREGNNISSVLQLGASQKPLKPQKAAPAQAAAPQQKAAPAPRAAAAPAPAATADLPF